MNGVSCNHDEGCITCGDVAVPLRVVALGDDAFAVCRDERGAIEEVDVSLVESVEEGDLLLVHARVALVWLEAGPSPAGYAGPEAESRCQNAGLDAPRR